MRLALGAMSSVAQPVDAARSLDEHAAFPEQEGRPMGAALGSLRGLFSLVSLAGLAVAQTPPPFTAAATYAAGAGPTGVVLRDVNRDGKPDLVVANESIDRVSVALGAGDGSFGVANSFAV